MYIPVKYKFIFAFLTASAWFTFCTWLAWPWIEDLANYIGLIFSIIIVSLIALIPGFMNCFLLMGYLLDKKIRIKKITQWPGVSILIPCLNEENEIANTILSVSQQIYPGKIEIIVIDNGSTDNTLKILRELFYPNLIILTESNKGKSNALNTGLKYATFDYIISVDADTYLMPLAIKNLMANFLSRPSDTAAVAGSVYVKNSRVNLITKMQEYDYFNAIAIIKRMQSLLQGTLVAQGAFSLYKKSCIQKVGGWKNSVGEDIILTWGLLAKGYRVGFAEDAIAFTNVPQTYKQFYLQRRRWSQGMIEAFIEYPQVLMVSRLTLFLIYWNLLFPAIDSCYLFIFIPGIIAAFFGYYFIVGPMTLAVLPITILMNAIFFFGQKHVFVENKLKVRRNIFGFLCYALSYYLIMVPACVHGYLLEIFKLKKMWGNK